MDDVNPLTVRGLIEYLEGLDPEATVPLGDEETDSYRGYYGDVYVTRGTSTAAEVLAMLRANVGTMMYGYKGGEYIYGDWCRVFVAYYGCTGDRLAVCNGELVTLREDW